MKLNSYSWFSLCVLCALCGEISSAPTSLTSLFPAGGQIGTTVEVVASGSFDTWPVEVWTSANGVTAKAMKDKGKLSVTIAADAKPGVTWVRLHDDSGASSPRPFLVGTLPDVAENEPNDDVMKSQSMDRSCVVNGKLAKGGDVDVFTVKLTKGQTLVASLEANCTLRSPLDTVLQVVSADGFVLDQNHDHRGLDPQLVYTAPKDGTFLVRIFAFPSQPDSSIRFFGSDACVYRLTLTTSGFVDFPLPLATSRNSSTKTRLIGWNLETSPLVPSPIAVRDEDHNCFDFTTTKPTDSLSPPFTLTGCVKEPHTTNTFPVNVTKGKPVVFQIESRSLELPLTPVLRVVDESGKPLVRAEPAKPNADCELTFTPTKDETVRVEVRDLYHEGGPRFVYRLRAVFPDPDVELSVANDRFALPPGKPLDVPVTISRKNGFKLPLELKAEGLPADVAASVIPPMGKEDKTMTLRFTTEKAGVSTSFRIVGTVKEQPKFVRPVRATLADFETTTADLWLTVSSNATVAPPMPKKKK